MTLVHNFEGSTDGTTIAAGATSNSDTPGNNYFDGVNICTGGTVAFSSAVAHGGLFSMRNRIAAAADNLNGVVWDTQHGSLTDDYCRAYLYLTDAFTINAVIVKWFSGALASMARLVWTTTNKLQLQDNTGTQVGISTTTLPTGALIRVEAHFLASTTAAQLTARLFIGANLEGATPDETITSTTWAGPAATSARIDFGQDEGSINQPGNNGFLYYDDIAAAAPDWLGPALPLAPIAPREDVNRIFGPF